MNLTSTIKLTLTAITITLLLNGCSGSDYYAPSLDVKADAKQKDSAGAQAVGCGQSVC